MNRALQATVAALVVVALVLGYRAMRVEDATEEHDAAIVAPSHVERGDGGSVTVKLDATAQQHAGLAMQPARPETRTREMKAYGRVLDPSPLIAAAAEEAAARTTLDAATKELQRVRLLATDQNASKRTVEAAEAAVAQAQIALDATHARLLVGWGDALANGRLSDLVHALAVGEAALVRIDLAAGETAEPKGARVATVDGKTAVDAELLGRASSVDPQTQGEGFLALVRPNTAHLLAGQAVLAFLKLDGEPRSGVVIPSSAVVRSAGKAWAYVRTSPDGFARREIALDEPVDGGWFVVANVAAGEEIVVTGAQTLLSEEQKSALPAED